MSLIFQYGSNCLGSRLNSPDRLDGNARNPLRAETVEEFDIAFDIWSQGNGCAASDLIKTPDRHCWGVLYDIPEEWAFGRRDDRRRTLEQIEGRYYVANSIKVRNQAGEEIDATTFLVKPLDRQQGLWTSAKYVGYIVCGLRAHEVPEDYVQHVIDVAIDTNCRAKQTAEEQNRLIESLRQRST